MERGDLVVASQPRVVVGDQDARREPVTGPAAVERPQRPHRADHHTDPDEPENDRKHVTCFRSFSGSSGSVWWSARCGRWGRSTAAGPVTGSRLASWSPTTTRGWLATTRSPRSIRRQKAHSRPLKFTARDRNDQQYLHFRRFLAFRSAAPVCAGISSRRILGAYAR